MELDAGGWLLLHFGMTGRLKYFQDMAEDPPHDRLLVTFENGYHLALEDQRMPGKVDLIGDPEDFVEEHELGPDLLDLDFSSFRERLRGRKGAVKSVLMNQQLFAGVGNIYSDEILFQARIHPKTGVERLDEKSVKKLHDETQRVLRAAIQRGANPQELPDSFLLPHRREGERCPRDNSEIQKIKVSGRTAYYCPACQPER